VERVDGNPSCRIRQVPDPGDSPAARAGWYYVEDTVVCEPGGAIRFTEGAELRQGSVAELHCSVREGVCD
jgi:hypothetical protein